LKEENKRWDRGMGVQGAIKHMSGGYAMESEVDVDLGRNHEDMGRASISSRKGRKP
jgi:hypothetical protein